MNKPKFVSLQVQVQYSPVPVSMAPWMPGCHRSFPRGPYGSPPLRASALVCCRPLIAVDEHGDLQPRGRMRSDICNGYLKWTSSPGRTPRPCLPGDRSAPKNLHMYSTLHVKIFPTVHGPFMVSSPFPFGLGVLYPVYPILNQTSA